jgi:hypothetical protein
MSERIIGIGRRRSRTWAYCAALFATIAGCERGGEPAMPAFVPSWEEARQSLESSLAAWRDAPSPDPSLFAIRGVQFADSTCKPDQRLSSFQILAQTDIENARQFTVRLNLEGEETPILVKYYVVGREPVWVVRLDDFEKSMHWEHDMSSPAPVDKPKTDVQPTRANQ